jgi:hypothetical protein
VNVDEEVPSSIAEESQTQLLPKGSSFRAFIGLKDALPSRWVGMPFSLKQG